MLRYSLLLLVLLLVMSGCGNRNDSNNAPDSELAIRMADSNVVISTPNDRGAITLTVGQQRDLEIIRTVREGTVQPVVNDVTGNVDANFSEPTVASFDVNGLLSALTVGFTEMELVFRDGDTDPTDDDKVVLDVTVLAAP